MSDPPLDLDVSVPFPIEFLIRDVPRSHQSGNAQAKGRWKEKVGATAKAHLDALRDFSLLDDRALAATIFYFPPEPMRGDVDNIVKLIVDGMVNVVYPDDRHLERVVVQKFEPGVAFIINSLTPTLEEAIETMPPVIYIRIDDDLGWRELP